MSEAVEKDYTLEQIAAAMDMSTRWVRDQLKDNTIAHRRPGGRIRMSADQLEQFKARYDVVPVVQSITTGRKRRA